jgi:hypothetical protein
MSYVHSPPEFDCDYFNSSSMSSVTSADSESSPRPDKRPASPAQSPQPKRARPTELSLDNSGWEGDNASTNAGEQSSIVSGSPRIQLPSIFATFEDPFRGEPRRASLPTLSSELSSRSRLPSVTPASRGLASATHTPSSLSSYQFPQSSLDSDDKSSVRPRLATDTQLGLSFPDQASLPSAATLSSSGTANSSSTSPSFPTSSFGSPLTADYNRAQLPSLQFSDSESWGTATGQAASLPGIVRPNSTPGPLSSTNGPLKYDDNLRHSSLSSSYTFPPSSQGPMYGVARISGQAERRASYTQPSSEAVKDEWSFSSPDIMLPSASTNGSVQSPSRTPPAPPTSSSLVDRPQKKRGKLPKPTTDFLKDWLHRHSDHPYPSEDEKKQLCAATGLSMSQVSNWMINVGLTNYFLLLSLLTLLTISRLADGFSHPYIGHHLVQLRHIPLHRNVEQLTPEFRLAHCFDVHLCLPIVCNYTTHSLCNLSHTHRRARSVLTRITHLPASGIFSRTGTVVGAPRPY